MLEERFANISDLHFINGCILYGARKGHYSIDTDNANIVRCMKKEIKFVVNDKRLLDGRRAQAAVYSVDSKRVAMSIISEATIGSSCYELYAMSVVKSHQGKGYGAQILDSILNHFVYQDICARCLPASVKMKRLLVQRGFKFNSMNKDCVVMLKEAEDYCDMPEPAFINYSYS